MNPEIQVLNKGFVRLDGVMADDLSVVNAARVSFAKRKEIMDTSDAGLISYLMKNRHGTPFEHNAFRFHVKLPIFVAREWMRHRISSFNEWSARYSEIEPEFYIPDIANVRMQVPGSKPGHYEFMQVPEGIAQEFCFELERESYRSFDFYKTWMNDVAKELSRCFLPVNVYTQMYWTVNARSLMNFLSLRNSESAQLEIREYAKVLEQLFAEQMPVTAQAFLGNGRVAP